MTVNIEALVELEGTKAYAEKVAKGINTETGLTAKIEEDRIVNLRTVNPRTVNSTNAHKTYRIILRGTSESEGEAESLLTRLRSTMKNYGGEGYYPMVAISSVEPITTETLAKPWVSPAYFRRARPHYGRRGAR